MSTGLIITTAVVKALQPQLQQHQEPPAGPAAAFMPQPSRRVGMGPGFTVVEAGHIWNLRFSSWFQEQAFPSSWP